MIPTTPTKSKNANFEVICSLCETNYDHVFQPFCEKCGGITEVIYDLSSAQLHESENPYERFQDLLPVRDRGLLPKDAVYTPAIHAKKLGEALGLPNLYLKDETTLPSKTTKDRMAATALPYLYECGVKTFCTSSTGNSSTAFSRALPQFDSLKLFLFTASDFYKRVQFAEHPNITHYVMRGATFAEASDYAGTFAKLNGFVSERGFFNLARREGLKLTFLEATDQIPGPIHWYVQAISSAMGAYGVFKGAKELRDMGHISTLPRLLCVQQETCSPMARAWRDGSETIQPEHIFEQPSGIAEAILRGNPTRTYPHVRKTVKESSGNIIAVSEEKIRAARRMVEELEGISPCFAASAAVAGLIHEIENNDFPLTDTVLINLTGTERPQNDSSEDAENVKWLYRSEKGWLPEEPERENGLVQSGNT